jgi:hypothetical protein
MGLGVERKCRIEVVTFQVMCAAGFCRRTQSLHFDATLSNSRMHSDTQDRQFKLKLFKGYRDKKQQKNSTSTETITGLGRQAL